METLDYDHNAFDPRATAADANLAVRFYTHPIRNEAKSIDAGRPIFEDTEMVEIRVRGDRNNVVQRPARDDDKARFRAVYRAFKEGLESQATGTPLKEWPIMSASMVQELAYLGFHTVEQVAEANDGVCSKVAGLTGMKNKAKAFLELAQGTAPLEKLQSQLEQEKNRADALQAQLQDMAARMTAMEAKQPAVAAVKK